MTKTSQLGTHRFLSDYNDFYFLNILLIACVFMRLQQNLQFPPFPYLFHLNTNKFGNRNNMNWLKKWISRQRRCVNELFAKFAIVAVGNDIAYSRHLKATLLQN